MIRAVRSEDAEAVAGIYNYYVENTVITFEETPVSAGDFSKRIENITEAFPWLVMEIDGEITGYAYAGRWNERSAYRFSVESTVYLAHDHVGKGVGTALMTALIEKLKERSIHQLIAGVALPNEASARLHEKLGFKKAAHYKEVGYKFGRWIDVGYWQLRLGNVPKQSEA